MPLSLAAQFARKIGTCFLGPVTISASEWHLFAGW